MPEIWRRLDAVGLQTTEACGDCPRVVLGSPLAGESARRGDRRHPGDQRDRRALHRQAGVLQPAAQVQDRDLGPAGRRARGQRRRVHRRQPPRARPGPRSVGRRRPVDQPDAGPAGRRLGAARRGARRVGGRGHRVPRLRLPPAAGQGAAEVPDQGLGRGEIPGGSRGRVPGAQADRRPGARPGDAPHRPRRRAEAQERPQRRRRRADRRPGVRHHPVQGRRPGRGRGLGPHPLHAVPEADRPGRARRQARRAACRPGRARAAVAPRRTGGAT